MIANPRDEDGRTCDTKIVRYDDAPDECTIYSPSVCDEKRTTAWLTAQEGSFCQASLMR